MIDQSSSKRATHRSDGDGQAAGSTGITRGDNLVEKLANDIASAVFPPGSRLDEVTLATRYGVSRTPVREALRQLESTGLIERRPFRGAIVSSPSPEHLADMFVAASEIEATCARLAALAMTPGERSALRKTHERIGETTRNRAKDDYREANEAFHERLYLGTHNATMASLARDMRRRLRPFMRTQFDGEGRVSQSYAEHEEIVQAIERGNGDAAANLMRHHMRQIEEVRPR